MTDHFTISKISQILNFCVIFNADDDSDDVDDDDDDDDDDD